MFILKYKYIYTIGYLMGLKNNMKHTYDITKNIHYENQSHSPRLDRIENKLDLLGNKVDRLLMFHIGETKSKTSHLFPLQNQATILDFLNTHHPDFEKRRKEFSDLMLLTITDDLTEFTGALFDNFFTREFASAYKWPPPG